METWLSEYVCVSTCYTCSRKAAGWTGWRCCWSVAGSSAPALCCSSAPPAHTHKRNCSPAWQRLLRQQVEKIGETMGVVCQPVFLYSDLTWLKRCGSTVSGRALVRPESWRDRQGDYYWAITECAYLPTSNSNSPRSETLIDKYLGGSPVNPAFAIGVDVEQNQTFHQVREDQLNRERF